jgi:hypothetical protein
MAYRMNRQHFGIKDVLKNTEHFSEPRLRNIRKHVVLEHVFFYNRLKLYCDIYTVRYVITWFIGPSDDLLKNHYFV